VVVEALVLDRDDGVAHDVGDLAGTDRDPVHAGVQARDQGAVGGVHEGGLG